MIAQEDQTRELRVQDLELLIRALWSTRHEGDPELGRPAGLVRIGLRSFMRELRKLRQESKP